MEEVNKYSPFPIFDTEDVENLRQQIKDMNYDDEKVECCKECKWLHLTEDENNNYWCSKCNTPNSIEECENIFDYMDKYGHIWTLD